MPEVRDWTGDETPRYRKKAKKSSPAKSKHKHEYKSCVFIYHMERYHGDTKTMEECLTIGNYCHLCGKVGDLRDEDWLSGINYTPTRLDWLKAWSPEAEAQFDQKTRTLPTFDIGDKFPYAKFVDLSAPVKQG